jgi:hypothetical protein
MWWRRRHHGRHLAPAISSRARARHGAQTTQRATKRLLIHVDLTTSSSTVRARAWCPQMPMDPWRSPSIYSSSPPLGVHHPLWWCAWPGTAWPQSGAAVVDRATVPPLMPLCSSLGNSSSSSSSTSTPSLPSWSVPTTLMCMLLLCYRDAMLVDVLLHLLFLLCSTPKPPVAIPMLTGSLRCAHPMCACPCVVYCLLVLVHMLTGLFICLLFLGHPILSNCAPLLCNCLLIAVLLA